MSIVIDNVNVHYDNIVALRDVSFTVEQGEFIGIIGPNGGGKSTLVKTMLGLIEPQKGNVYLGENSVLGYVPQFASFDRKFPISVEEVVLTGHLPKKFKIGKSFSQHEKNHAKEVLEQLGISDLRHRQIGALSGGQLQRVLIARALMNHPTILVLDEPTAGVDEKSKEAIYTMLRKLNRTMTIMMITHDTEDIIASFDRVIYINQTIHIHDHNKINNKLVDVTYNKCPINWFVEGSKIQKEMLHVVGKKEVHNDRSNS